MLRNSPYQVSKIIKNQIHAYTLSKNNYIFITFFALTIHFFSIFGFTKNVKIGFSNLFVFV